MTQTRNAWKAQHRFSTARLAALFPTQAEVEKEIREMRAQRSLRGDAAPVTADEAVGVICEVRYLALRMGATTRALNMRWRKIR